MPVVDLAEYLGMPAQAPQQPMFQTTQRMAPALSQADLIRQNTAAFETLGNLQRLAPAVQAQQAQLAYDTVAQQARDLRMKQEIEAQAERAVNEMIGAGVTPESADYSTRMRDLVVKNPLAVRDPGFQQIVGLFEDQNRAFQRTREEQMQAEAASQKALNEDILRATEAGVDPRLLQGVQDRQMVAYLKSQLPRGGGSGMPDEARRLEKRADLKAKQLAAFGEYPDLEDPEYQEARLAAREAQDAWDNYLQTGVVPSATAPQATTQTVRPPLQAAANAGGQVAIQAEVPFRDTMKSLAGGDAPKVEDLLKVTEEEVIQDINSPEANEDTFMAAISDPNLSTQAKTIALSRFKEFAKYPTRRPEDGINEAIQRKEAIKQKVANAERLVRADPVVKEYSSAWTASKNAMAQSIQKFAQTLGLDVEDVENSLRRNDEVLVRQPQTIQGIAPLTAKVKTPARTLFERFLADELETSYKNPLSRPDDRLSKFTESEFADVLGVQGISIPGFGAIKRATGRITRGNVLDEYLKERTGAAEAPQESIVSVSTKEEVEALPKGSKFRGPDGKVRIK